MKSGISARKHAHGRTHYWIEGEGFCGTELRFSYGRGEKTTLPYAGTPQPDPPTSDAFRFCRLFKLKPFNPPDEALIALGLAMDDTEGPAASNADIAAGFTYLGQFVDHDITFDMTLRQEQGFPLQNLSPQQLIQRRSPALDLDSLYGEGPQVTPEFYEADRLHFRIGTTTGRPIFGVTDAFPNDLPRHPADGSEQSRKAIIGDPRNDENLAVAQTHLAFLKLHNKVVDTLPSGDATARFNEARRIVTQHYQSIVLHDFVSRLADHGVYEQVLSSGRRIFSPKGFPNDKPPCMPIEFSVAAYRLGHSMIRNGYQWNRVFNSNGPGPVASLELIFEFSQVSTHMGLFVEPTVPSDWIIDWRRFFDFPSLADRPERSNKARLIDVRLATKLTDLPEFKQLEPHLRSLAVRNLLRGRLVGLPSGQDIAAAVGVTALTETEILTGPHTAVLQQNGFQRRTPLWYYIIKEAEVQHGGQRLGQVGSRILVETFHGIVEGSRHSILKEAGWKPTLPSQNPNIFTMADMLSFIDELNPLGDGVV